MTPEIKQRIEQMCRGEVPSGYKKGKLGIVPEEWNETSFSTLFTSTSDYTDDLDKYPLYSLTIEDGITPKTERYERSHLVKKEDSYKIVRPNDYAYNPMNLRFGAVARHKGNMPVAVSGYYDIFTTVHESDLPFMDSFLTCGPMITYYNRVSTGSLVEKQRVHFSQFLEFVLPLPSINERAKIAANLTTQDKVIELKEKRLAEKQRQKKYLMQQLLTGKKRLPGFSGKWKNIKLCEVLSERKEKNVEQNSRICSVAVQKGVVDQVEHLGRSYAANDTSNYSVAHYGDIIYTKSPTGDFQYGIVKQNLLQETVAVSPLYGVFTPMTFGLGYFLHTYFQSVICARNYLLPIVQKGAKNTINITNDTFISNKLYLPLDAKEQKAIADTFIAADLEIDLLRQDIEQEKQKKKALMQLLLTGIVRVQNN